MYRFSSKVMTKNILKRFLVIVAALVIAGLMPAAAFADGDFDTTQYNVKMSVHGDASAHVAEDISVDIHSPMHGIYRYIPLSRKIEYKAGGSLIQQSYAAMKVDNVSVDIDPYKSYREQGNIVIRIGDEDKTISGIKDYSFSYDVHMYKDDAEKYDSFYYNVLPFDWDTSIENAKITIAMPKSFEKKNIYVMAGNGSTNVTDSITWEKKGKTIVINTKGELPKGCGITVGIKLPEGYFDNEPTHSLSNIILMAFGGLFVLIMGFLWYRFGRDPKHIQTVEFYPPEGITSGDVGYIIDGHVDKKDVVSLLFYFAQNGLITIEEEGKNDYRISKIQDLPPTAKEYERVFMNGLFGMGDNVLFSSLQDTFYDTFTTTKEMIQAGFETRGQKIFRGKANIIRILALIIPPIAAGFLAWMIWRTYGSFILLAASVGAIVFSLAGFLMGMYVQDRRFTLGSMKRLTLSVVSMILTVVAMLLTVYIAVAVRGNWIIAILFALVIAMGYFGTRFMRSRTRNGAELLGKILGLKDFIRVAEKDRLERMIEENPQYFYDVLPYAYVMGLSKKWAKKFEGIAVEPPTWYRSASDSTMFNSLYFYSMFNDFSKYADASIKAPSVDSSDGGGFGGGGGFSVGGGFGGGGGGGW
ncbi:MAG: DUF2207 domain-containing protein [Firmicutes bacterium]|nr:DUF2207 domain-containing protein [Bacillota bacterium]